MRSGMLEAPIRWTYESRNVRKVDFLDTAILQKRAFYWQNEWYVQSQLRYIFNSKSHNILNRNNGVTFKETFGVTKSK